MLTIGEARAIVELDLAQSEMDLVIVMEEEVGEYGWVFYYQSRQFVKNGDEMDKLFGNCPYIVSRVDGTITRANTADLCEIEYCRKYGQPTLPEGEPDLYAQRVRVAAQAERLHRRLEKRRKELADEEDREP